MTPMRFVYLAVVNGFSTGVNLTVWVKVGDSLNLFIAILCMLAAILCLYIARRTVKE